MTSLSSVDRLRQAIADTLSIDAQGLQAAIGQLVVATSAEYPAAGPQDRSLYSAAVRTTVLLADRIPAGQEAQALAQEIERHHGRQAAQAVLGARTADLLGMLLVVDGTDEAGNFAGDAPNAPFVIFDVDRQENIAGPFDSRELAEQRRVAILAGDPPVLDIEALLKHDAFQNWKAGVEQQLGGEVDGEAYRSYFDSGLTPAEAVLQERLDADVLEPSAAQQLDTSGPSSNPKKPAVYMLAELSWSDDAYGEDLPVAGLFRMTEEIFNKVDRITRLINDGVLSRSGAYASVPAEDVAWLRRVNFTSENTLASVPGFFDARTDRVVYICDAADIELDGERADFGDQCERFELTDEGDRNLSALRVQAVNELGVAVYVTGAADGWTMGGYLESWDKLRGTLEPVLAIPATPDALTTRLAQALPANEGYEKGFKDALESMALALAPNVTQSTLDDAIATALDAYANNADALIDHAPAHDDAPTP